MLFVVAVVHDAAVAIIGIALVTSVYLYFDAVAVANVVAIAVINDAEIAVLNVVAVTVANGAAIAGINDA